MAQGLGENLDINIGVNVTGLPQIQQVQTRMKNLNNTIKKTTSQYNANVVATNKWAKGALQQAGYQVGDFAVQVANGTSAVQAFGQQGSQLLGIFGPIGAVLGAGVAIFAALGVAVQKSGMQVANLGAALGVLEQPLGSIVSSVKKLGGIFDGVMPVIVNNIDTAIIAAGLFASVLAVKMVGSMIKSAGASAIMSAALMNIRAGMVAASISTGRFSMALGAAQSAVILLSGALKAVSALFMRFLPIVLIAGLAKAVEMFLQLKRGAGGFAVALGLLRDFAVEAFDHILKRGQFMYLKLENGVLSFQRMFINALVPIAQKFEDFVNDLVDNLNAAFPETGMFSALRIKIRPEFGTNLEETSKELDAAIKSNEETISELNETLSGPSRALEEIRKAFRNGANDANFFGDAVADAAGKGGKKIDEELSPALKRASEISKMVGGSMETAMMSIVDGTKSVKDAFKSMASEIIKELYRIFVVKRITGFISDAIGFAALPAGGTYTGSFGLPNFSSYDGGGYTGNGARAGGLDGKGGFMAMLHPRETILDHTKGQGGGVIVNQTINVSTGVQQTVRTEIKQLMPQIADAAKSAVVDAKLRGGSYGRAFA